MACGGDDLGWNPVQGGSLCDVGVTATYAQVGDALQLTVQPSQWDPQWQAITCGANCFLPAEPVVGVQETITLRYVSPNVVEIAFEAVINDGLDHTWNGQEVPCLYPSNGGLGSLGPDLNVLVDGAGNPVAVNADGAVLSAPTSVPWMSWQDATQQYGVGMANDEGVLDFLAILNNASPLTPFRYLRADVGFAMASPAIVRTISYLALGGPVTVDEMLGEALSKRPPFGQINVPGSGTVTSYVPGSDVQLAGWVLDTVRLSDVVVTVDGVAATTLPVATARPDVCAVYPDYDGCPTQASPNASAAVGFSGQLSTAGLSLCPHLVQITATDPDGNTTILGEREISPQ
jgi:hypothetical protein